MKINLPDLKGLPWPEQKISMLVIIGLASLVAVGSVIGGVFIELARGGAVLTLFLQIIVELRGRQKRFLTSPLFLLSAIGVFFFSIAQAIWMPEGPWPRVRLDFTTFVGSQAEGVILAFCMACLVTYLVTYREMHIGRSLSGSIIVLGSKKLFICLFMFSVLISGFDIMLYSLRALQTPFLIKLHFIAPPLLALSLSLLMRNVKAQEWVYKVVLFVLLLVVLGGMIYVGESKVVVFIMASLLLYGFRIFDFSLSQLIFAALAASLFIIALVQIVQHAYWKVGDGHGQVSSNYSRIFMGKGVLRQSETGYCLNNVLKSHANEPFNMSKQAFWVKGLVPRILWRNKPSLSFGQEYATEYCYRLQHQLGQNSSSITLLGQPVINGGIIGLIIHGGLLLLALAGIENLNANRKSLSTALVVALLPWLIDFDQDFAMYVANAVKSTLVMLILFVPMVLIERYGGGRYEHKETR